jgi:hypothetical protein
MKTAKDLVNELMKREALKEQVNVAQMTEVVGCLADLVYESEDLNPMLTVLHKLGKKREKDRGKKPRVSRKRGHGTTRRVLRGGRDV